LKTSFYGKSRLNLNEFTWLNLLVQGNLEPQ